VNEPPSLRPRGAGRLLLRAALLDGEPAREAWRAWREVTDLDRLDGGSLRLLPLAYSNLEGDLGDDSFARWVSGIVRASWLKGQSLTAGARAALEELTAAGIPILLVKGVAVAPYFERGFAVRPMSDLDLAVPARDRRRAWQVLERRGFRPFEDADCDSPRFADRGSWNFVDARGADLDLHWWALPDLPHSAAEELVWRAARPSEIAGVACLLPAPRHVLFQVVLHAADWEPSPALHWAADVVHLLRYQNASAIDWPALVREARALRIAAPIHAALAWLKEEFAAPVPGDALQELARAPSWQRRELASRLTDPSTRSTGQRRIVAFAHRVRRDLPPGSGPSVADRMRLEAAHRHLRGRWALPLWATFVAFGRPTALRRLAERLRRNGEPVPEWPLGRRLGFGRGQSAEPFLHSGWLAATEHGRWTGGPEARLHVRLAEEPVRGLRLEAHLIPNLDSDSPECAVDVWANRRRIARWRFTGKQPRPIDAVAEIPPGVLGASRELHLLFHVRNARPLPDPLGYARELPALGVHVGWIRIASAA